MIWYMLNVYFVFTGARVVVEDVAVEEIVVKVKNTEEWSEWKAENLMVKIKKPDAGKWIRDIMGMHARRGVPSIVYVLLDLVTSNWRWC